MKTASSLSDNLFRLAENTARQLRMSRSQLYSVALSEFLERHHAAKITERLNEVYSKEPAKLDPAFHFAQLKSLESDSW